MVVVAGMAEEVAAGRARVPSFFNTHSRRLTRRLRSRIELRIPGEQTGRVGWDGDTATRSPSWSTVTKEETDLATAATHDLMGPHLSGRQRVHEKRTEWRRRRCADDVCSCTGRRPWGRSSSPGSRRVAPPFADERAPTLREADGGAGPGLTAPDRHRRSRICSRSRPPGCAERVATAHARDRRDPGIR